MCVRIWKSGLSEHKRMDKMLQKEEELGYYKAKCCKTAARASRAVGGDFSERRGIRAGTRGGRWRE